MISILLTFMLKYAILIRFTSRTLKQQTPIKWAKIESWCSMRALLDGIYSCSNDGQTILRRAEQAIPPCSCGKGRWEPTIEHNFKSAISVLVSEGDSVYNMDIADIPEKDSLINVVFPRIKGFKDGRYRVDSVSEAGVHIYVSLTKVGELDWKNFFHRAYFGMPN